MPDEDSISQNPFAPPQGDFHKAEKYINKLVSLLSQDKLSVIHTDLNQFDPTTLQDHYRIDLKDYRIEISHSKQQETGKNSYVCVFTNIPHLSDHFSKSNDPDKKIILAYIQLTENQFEKFKNAAKNQLDKIKKVEEEQRFEEALKPIDQLLESSEDQGLREQSLSDYLKNQSENFEFEKNQ